MRPSLPLLALLCALLYLPGLGARDLWAPDEPRYAQIAREMVRSGDWIVPRDNGRVYADKPPLLFWLIALASLPAGEVGEVGARLPVALCGIGTALLTAAIGRLWLGAFRGFAAGLILATSWRGFASAQWVQTDAPLALFTTLAILGLARALARDGGARPSDLAMLHGGVAGALLAKGPVGLVLVALVAAGWAASERRAGFLRGLRPGLLLAAAAPAAAWALAAGAASSGVYSPVEALRHHALERFAHGLHHPRPALYYAAIFPLDFLPWTAFLAAWAFPPAALDAGARLARRRALVWLALPFLFFSLSAEKRGVYLLPLAPAAALLIAACWSEGGWPRPGEAGRRAALAPFAALVAIALLSLGLPALAWRHLGAGEIGLSLASLGASAAALAAFGAARRGEGRAALGWACAAPALLFLGASLAGAPALDPLKSARPFCERTRARMQAGDRLGMYRFYRSAYVFYTGRSVEVLEDAAALERFLGEGGAWCIVEAQEYERLPEPLRRRHPPLESAGVGHRRVILIGAPADAGASSRFSSTATPRPRRG